MLRAARIRVGQFFAVLRARAHPPTLERAELLEPVLFELFSRMPPEDQRHGLEVLSILERRGASDPLLLTAGLLHDVGKADSGVAIGHRILRVLLARRLPKLWGWLSGRPTGWRRPFWVVANHPERGAVWIESVGGEPDLARLVRYHESDAPPSWQGTRLETLHEELAAADAQC